MTFLQSDGRFLFWDPFVHVFQTEFEMSIHDPHVSPAEIIDSRSMASDINVRSHPRETLKRRLTRKASPVPLDSSVNPKREIIPLLRLDVPDCRLRDS